MPYLFFALNARKSHNSKRKMSEDASASANKKPRLDAERASERESRGESDHDDESRSTVTKYINPAMRQRAVPAPGAINKVSCGRRTVSIRCDAVKVAKDKLIKPLLYKCLDCSRVMGFADDEHDLQPDVEPYSVPGGVFFSLLTCALCGERHKFPCANGVNCLVGVPQSPEHLSRRRGYFGECRTCYSSSGSAELKLRRRYDARCTGSVVSIRCHRYSCLACNVILHAGTPKAQFKEQDNQPIPGLPGLANYCQSCVDRGCVNLCRRCGSGDPSNVPVADGTFMNICRDCSAAQGRLNRMMSREENYVQLLQKACANNQKARNHTHGERTALEFFEKADWTTVRVLNILSGSELHISGSYRRAASSKWHDLLYSADVYEWSVSGYGTINEFAFPILLRYKSACSLMIDREDDNNVDGYLYVSKLNFVPRFMASVNKLRLRELGGIVCTREQTRECDHDTIASQIVEASRVKGIIYFMAHGMIRRKAHHKVEMLNNLVNAVGNRKAVQIIVAWLCARIVLVGARCELTGITFDMARDATSCLRPSPDRVDGNGAYKASNIEIVCLAFNLPPINLGEDFDRFPKVIWDRATGVTPEVAARIAAVREADRRGIERALQENHAETHAKWLELAQLFPE